MSRPWPGGWGLLHLTSRGYTSRHLVLEPTCWVASSTVCELLLVRLERLVHLGRTTPFFRGDGWEGGEVGGGGGSTEKWLVSSSKGISQRGLCSPRMERIHFFLFALYHRWSFPASFARLRVSDLLCWRRLRG